jgi:branched-chain amino acid transport system ATP-binding protein
MNENQAGVLEVIGLNAGYDKRHVLRNVNMVLREREVLAILGHNGAGKTTLLATIFGLVKPTSGRINLFDRDISGHSPSSNVADGIALVPQGHGVFPSMTVAENLSVGAGSIGPRGAVADHSMTFALFPILKERFRQLAGTLSGGQQQMLAISMALARRPRVLMLDEPSIGLAPNLVDRVLAAIRIINQEFKLSVVLVEQNVTKSLAIADRVVILKAGSKVYDGAPDPLRNQVELMNYF